MSKLLFTQEDIASATLRVAADMNRFNALASIYNAGSGHIGASFSCMDILTVLYREHFNRGQDTFILSKGHAAAGLYAVLAGQGYFPVEKLLTFRKLGGLPGHSDISVPGVDANTGSLGMGISKAAGWAWSNKHWSFVLVGDGELQEGQNWEAIRSAAHMKLGNLIMIVDANEVQTDRQVSQISSIEPLMAKLQAFGWTVVSIDGHDINEIQSAFHVLMSAKGGYPKAIIANTTKGEGVSFMEYSGGDYAWHSGIPSKEQFEMAAKELLELIYYTETDIDGRSIELPCGFVPERKSPFFGKPLKQAFSEWLVKSKNTVVFDADLSADCGLRQFEKKYPKRFIECGIAEQDMVSMAGAVAMSGKLPIVNSYAAFLTSRANEQIYNNATERTSILYVGHLAGLLPGKPGKSHQAVRDISLLAAIPGITMAAPCEETEMAEILDIMAGVMGPSYLRLEHAPHRKAVKAPKQYKAEYGKGCKFGFGEAAAMITYGPLMVSECIEAMEYLRRLNIYTRVINLPWLNAVDSKWLKEAAGKSKHVVCVENHSVFGGQSAMISKLFKVSTIGVIGEPQSGDNEDVLRHYGLDYMSIANRIQELVG